MQQRWLLCIAACMFVITGCSVEEENTVEHELVEKEAESQQEVLEENEPQQEVVEEKEVQQDKQQTEDELAALYQLEKVSISRVVDGDTIVLTDGRKVRFVGVNTPESTTRTETYGEEAKNYTKTKLDGKQVWIQKDVSETDRYGRQLRIIWLSVPTDDLNESEIRTKMYNADLVLNGYAEPSTYPPDVKYSNYFLKFAREARETNKGLWAYGPNGTTKGDMDKSTSSETNSTTAPSSTPPAASDGKEYYQNCTELRKVYPDGVPSDHPAYASKHDRDKDNWACER